jgi:hypothetical protein
VSISEEHLMAFVDGELAADAREEIAAAAAADPALAGRIERLRRVRSLIGGAHGAALDEPVPERLLSAAQGGSDASGDVVELAQARAVLRPPVPWRAIGGMAACLAIGLLIGQVPTQLHTPQLLATRDGDIIAGGVLASALNAQLASTQHDEAVKIGISFRAQNGRYCRTFTIERSGLSGLACREPTAWVAQVTANAPGEASAADGYAQAASSLAPPVAAAVDQVIAGAPFDARAEAQAKAHGWRD